jgi:hypothetical protein
MPRTNTALRMRSADLAFHTVTILAPPGVLNPDLEVEVATNVPASIRVLEGPPEALTQGGVSSQTYYHVALRPRYTGIAAKPILPTSDMVLHEECHTQRAFQILAVVPSDLGDALDLRCVTTG